MSDDAGYSVRRINAYSKASKGSYWVLYTVDLDPLTVDHVCMLAAYSTLEAAKDAYDMVMRARPQNDLHIAEVEWRS